MTATTTTATATSTSPTATSTTSRSCTRAATRPTATRIQGEDAIWSHRWYAFQATTGVTGPASTRLGGTQIGNTGLWAGDYTVQPENGGLSSIAHEFGHDLGLPDHYDTAARARTRSAGGR